MVGGFEVDPGHTRGVGGLGDGRVLVAWQEWVLEEPRATIGGIWVEVFDAQGAYLGTAAFPGLWMDSFTTDPNGEFIYAGLSNPYPRVARYRIQEKLSR